MKPHIDPYFAPKDQGFDNSKFYEYSTTLRKKYVFNNRVLLIQTPQFLLETFDVEIARNRGYYAYPPTGLQWIAKALSSRNLEIDILDLNYHLLQKVIKDEAFDYNNWIMLLDDYLNNRKKPYLVGVSSINVVKNVFTDNYPLTMVLEYLKKRDESIVIAGGPIAGDKYEDYFSKQLCHFIIKGEGENKINFLFDGLFGCKSFLPPVSGIFFNFNNKIEQIAGHLDILKLEGNLIGTYDLVPIEDYNNAGSLNPYSRMVGINKRFAVFQLNRGCRASCKFCDISNFMGTGVRSFPVNDVIEEIQFLIEKKGVRHFDVLDDDFLLTKKGVTELLNALIPLHQKYGITWSSNNGLIGNSITEEIMVLMRNSGCVGFRIGIESGNPKMLSKMKKPVSLPVLKKVSAILNKFPEIFTGANYIIGLFNEETFGEMLQTFQLACQLNLDWASFSVFHNTKKAKDVHPGSSADGHGDGDFLPSKRNRLGEMSAEDGIVSGKRIFALPEDEIPSRPQLKQIWFAFNLVINYINNKNLRGEGNCEKFVRWVEAVKATYPYNPYMTLFSAFGRVSLGERKIARKHLNDTKNILKKSDYWRRRFSEFHLMDSVTNFPQTEREVKELLESLRETYVEWIK